MMKGNALEWGRLAFPDVKVVVAALFGGFTRYFKYRPLQMIYPSTYCVGRFCYYNTKAWYWPYLFDILSAILRYNMKTPIRYKLDVRFWKIGWARLRQVRVSFFPPFIVSGLLQCLSVEKRSIHYLGWPLVYVDDKIIPKLQNYPNTLVFLICSNYSS